LSKTLASALDTLKLVLGHREGKITGLSLIMIALILVSKNQNQGVDIGELVRSAHRQKKGLKGHHGLVNMHFFRNFWRILKIAVPSWADSVVIDLSGLTVLLAVRTFLSIYIAKVNGNIVQQVVKYDFPNFLGELGKLGMLSFPASVVNAGLEFMAKKIALKFRRNITRHFHSLYIKDLIYYQLTNIDSRIDNPDQRLTNDIDKWSTALSNLYINFTKPTFDLILFGQKLASYVTWRGPFYAVLTYGLSSLVMRYLSPAFGRMRATEQILEGEYRKSHTDLIYWSEEIAFQQGGDWEKNRINRIYSKVYAHVKEILEQKLWMGTFDSLMVKYGATLCGYCVLAIPVFGAGSASYLSKMKTDPSGITRDYIRNSSLLINMSKAIGRIAISYKELQNLAGYTHLINEMDKVLFDLDKGNYVRTSVVTEPRTGNLNMLDRGKFQEAQYIKFENVPIVSPNGDVLVESMNFQINNGDNCIISGPNGCGKSSSFRILGQLWPLFGGKVFRPKFEKLFYIPQRPYLPTGTLKDQIIYPHQKPAEGVTDENIIDILKEVKLGYLVEREGGLDGYNDWKEMLSGGEKQRIAMARLFYHKPEFAILDECTSAISLDVEHILYSKARELGITLFTISHRASLFKFHEYYLKFDGQGGYTFEKLKKEDYKEDHNRSHNKGEVKEDSTAQ
jgi:ATP-binding cassette subfamily D (ALD) protein 3